MKAEIRQKVDELMNCDDIFLNAMVSDLTGKPGIMAGKFAMYTCEKSECELDENNSISKGKHHREIRNNCLDSLEVWNNIYLRKYNLVT